MITFEQIIEPIGEGNIIYDESVTFVEKKGEASVPLLFEAEEILSVTSADKIKIYEENSDWLYKDNKLILTPNSRIFKFQKNDLVFDNEIKGNSFKRKDGKYSFFSEGHFFHDRQISVTYKKKDSKNFLYREEFCGKELFKTITKLKNREEVKIVLYGDSISEGANSSGMTVTSPFLPVWGALVAEKLRRHYNAPVTFKNTSLGGANSDWAIENAKTHVADLKPDLAIIAFGMNDRIEAEEFSRKIKKIVDIVSKESHDTEFILCATTLPNSELEEFLAYQESYKDALKTLEKKGVAVASFFDMQRVLLSKKSFIDLTGNNVNHPNDFMIRCHAQIILDMLIEH